ncbi:MAG: polysaccharide deacetylase family protein [Vicinamibacterales bacterium]
MISVILDAAGAGSRNLVRAADRAARQTVAGELHLATVEDSPVLPSLAARLGLRVHRASNSAASLNAALAASSHEIILLVSVPWLLDSQNSEGCIDALKNCADVSIVIPTLELQTPDGLTRRTLTSDHDLPALLANPRATPPVFAARRSAWKLLGALDERLGGLAACEWWFRVLAGGVRTMPAPDARAVLEANDRSWWPPITAGLDLTTYRAVLEKHRQFLDSQMSDLVVKLEMASGMLIREHRAQLAVRDRDLAELERARAETAHHRAYIEHHADLAIDWGDLRRADPVSRDWGYDRGTPIDRRYIDDFLAARSSDVAGAVLEVQEEDFTRRFGGPRVTHSDVVDLDDNNPRATVVADLRAAVGIPDARFDCIILTQTLHVIDDATAVVRECFRLLKPGGVLLATLPSASRACLEYGDAGDLWRVTPAGARALFEPVFGAGNVEVSTYGNVLTNVAFLHGLACRELSDEEFDTTDPYHPLLVGVRAQKETPTTRPSFRHQGNGVVLLYHRVDGRSDVHDLSVPAQLFEEQMAWLARNCRVMPLQELLAGAREGLPERAVAVTFDDGYLDTLQTASPILERLELPATVFATTRWLDAPGEYWWDLLERALLFDTPPPNLTVELNGAPVTWATSTLEERRAAHNRLHDHLVHASLAERDRVTSAVASWSGIAPDRSRRPLVADELRQLATAPGISIGAHTVNHLALPDQDPDAQRNEVLESILALERVMGSRIDLFAHPYGAVSRTTANLVRETCRWSAGCQSAAIGASFDAAAFPRLEVKRWDAPTLGHRLSACGFRPSTVLGPP